MSASAWTSIALAVLGAAALTVIAMAPLSRLGAPLTPRDRLLLPLAAAIPIQQAVLLGKSGAWQALMPPVFAAALGRSALALLLVHVLILCCPLAALLWTRPRA
jgi:peptidoglycan/LPS O-acetylase OafA/YrhL